MGKYDDIIHLPYPVSTTRPRMSIHDRAAQFSPFSALTGYEDSVRETARLTERKTELDEDKKEILDRCLLQLEAESRDKRKVCITYFQRDKKKEGGIYLSITGELKKIDLYNRYLLMTDGQKIAIEEITEIEIIEKEI